MRMDQFYNRILVIIAAVAVFPMSAARSDTAWTVPSGDYGVGANWSSGLPGPGNNAEIANGGTAFSFNLTLDGYALAVANAGSELATDFDLNVGNLGTGGLVIEEGGMVSTGWGASLGYWDGSLGEARVRGTGSSWTIEDALYVGRFGTGRLFLEEGGSVSAGKSDLGYGEGATGEVTVQAGAMWAIGSDLSVGRAGTGNLVTEEGGLVSTGRHGYLGYQEGATGVVTVRGTWTVGEGLYVGDEGAGELIIENGGRVETGTLFASVAALKGDGVLEASGVVLDGVNLVFDATHGLPQTVNFGSGGQLKVTADGRGDLGAGYRGTGELTIAEGIEVVSAYGYLGYSEGADGRATVRGMNSRWEIEEELFVGREGVGELLIEEGGTVSTGSRGYVGDSQGAQGRVTVSGAGSAWAVESLYVGNLGTGELVVEDGGSVSTRLGGHRGYSTGSQGSATVRGVGSTWTIDGEFYVGVYGTGEIVIEDGGSVSSGSGFLGYSSGSHGLVTVRGANSKWTTESDLSVGRFGTGELVIEDGGSVFIGGKGDVGRWEDSTGAVMVRGRGSILALAGSLVVGEMGSGSTLTIVEGGIVRVGDAPFGGSIDISVSGGTENFLRLDGGYLALFGDQTDHVVTLISGGTIQLWDGTEWKVSTDTADFLFGYFESEEAARAFSGYEGLGGYTILTTVPEPTVLGLLGVCAVALAITRRLVAVKRTRKSEV